MKTLGGHTLIDFGWSGFGPAQAQGSQCKIRLSRRGGEGLLARMYGRKGYVIDATLKHEHDESSIVVQLDDEAMGTITIQFDNGFIAAQENYPEHIEALRKKGARLCEFGKFAVDQRVRSKRVLGAMFHLAWILAFKVRHATDILIEVNPRHAPFYMKMLGFEQIGPERTCTRVNAPAVLLHLSSLKGEELYVQEKGRGFYPYFFTPNEQAKLIQKISESQ